ncbi:MAG: hypothetical protein HY209_03285 [Candidatus Omnitrophica bacterium]|nr:hypothetical protein [Candidatus Omnitrophota bacterium]
MKKDVLLVILVLISVGLLVTMVAILEKENKANKTLEEERYSRMVMEERLQIKEAKLVALETQLKAANEKMTKVQRIIDQQKNINTDLQKQYTDLNKAKTELESKLKTTLAGPAMTNSAPVAQ